MFISTIDIRPTRPRAVMAMLALVTLVFSSAASQAAAPPGSFADLAEKLLPSVVNISTTQTIKNPQGGMEMPQFPPGSPLEEFLMVWGVTSDIAPKKIPKGWPLNLQCYAMLFAR